MNHLIQKGDFCPILTSFHQTNHRWSPCICLQWRCRYKVVSTALDASKEKPVTVVADDTDVAVMLIYHWNEELSDIYFHKERGDKCWSIREALKSLSSIKQHILFIHAWSGCDSVSAIFGKGKPSFFKLVSKSISMQAVSETISDHWATSEEVSDASLKAFKELYRGMFH